MTDWSGNTKSAFITSSTAGHSKEVREKNDYYATEPSAIDDLFALETFSSNIWEPACGAGHLSQRMEYYGKHVYSTDLIYRGYGVGDINFFDCEYRKGFDIITNPPYKFAQEFVQKAIDLTDNKVAMFLKLTFLEGKKRKFFFKENPPARIYVYSFRRGCALGGEFHKYSTKAIAYAWFVWEKGFKGDPIIKWI